MAKTYLAGEAAVKLIPNSAGFHHQARKELKADKTLFHPVQLKADATGFRKDAQARLKNAKLTVDVSPRLDTTGFRKKAQAQLDSGRRLSLTVDLKANADRKTVTAARAAIQAQLDAMKPVTIRVEADTSLATARMMAWRRAENINPITIRVNADTSGANAAMRTLRMQQGKGSGGRGGGGAPLYRKVRTAAIGTGLTVAPIATNAAVGGLAALTGAASQATGALGLLPAAATAAGAGITALAVGLYGVVGAFTALSKEAQDTSMEDQGRKIASATRAVAGAERNLTKAQEGVRRAQADLNRERMLAVRRLRDMNDELRLAPLNEKEAALAIKEAQKRLAEAFASGDSLEIEGAQIDVEKSKIQYDILRKQNQDLYVDTMAANKAGVEGDEQVVAAKQGVVDANEAVLDAQDALTSAIEAQTEALTAQSAAADAAAKAMAKLSPNAREFVLAMRALGPEWTELRKAVQDRLFAGLGDDMTVLARQQLPTLRAGLEGINILLNRGMRDSMDVFSSPDAVNDFNATLGNTQLMFAGLADTARPLSQAWIDIVTVGSSFLPRFGLQMADVSTRFGEWIGQMRESGKMEAFFDKSIEMAKQLGRIISNVAHILGDFFSAGADTGGGFLNTIETATHELRMFTESIEGQTAMRDFFTGVAEAVRALAPILTIVAKTIFDTIGPALTDFVIGMGPGLVTFFEALRVGLQGMAPAFGPLGEAFGGILAALSPLLPMLGDLLGVLGMALANALVAVTPLIEKFVGYLTENPEVFNTIAIAIGGIALALGPIGSLIGTLMGPLSSLFGIFRGISAAMGPEAIIGLRTALSALMGPVGIIIGLLVTLFVTNEDFRNSVMQVLELLWGLVQQIIAAVMPVFNQLVEALMPLVTTIFNVLIDLVGQIVMAIMPSLIGIIQALIPVVMAVVNAVLGLVKAFIPLIETAVNIVTTIMPPLINILLAILLPIIRTLASVIEWAFKLAADIITWAVETIIVPIINTLASVFQWLADKVDAVVSWIVDDGFGYLQRGVEYLQTVFDRIVKGIGEAWGGLRRLAAEPIVFIIDNVINGAFKPAWNAIAKIVPGLDEWDGIDAAALKATIGGYATGGYVTGPGTGTSDSIMARLSNGEYVMKAATVRRIGVDRLDALNNGGYGAPDGDLRTGTGPQRFANGGIVQGGAELTSDIQRSMWDAVRTAFPAAVLTSGTRYADVGSGFDNHMGQRAIDLGGPMPQIAKWIYDTYGDSVLELIHWPLGDWSNLKNGAPLNYGEPTNSQHMDHVHWAMSQMVNSDGKMVSEDGGSGGILGWIKDQASKLLGKMVDLFEKPMRAFGDSIPDFGGSMIGSIPKNAFNGILDGALSWIKEKIGSGSSDQGGNVAYDIGGGAEQWRPLVEKLFTEKSIPMNLVDKYLYQIHRESTGDPNAINTWDSNAQAGTPSKGLAQVIDTTFAAYADPGYDTNIYDPESNLRASLNYLLKDPKFGGQGVAALTGAGYDTGGLLVPGNTLVTNNTGTNEYILTPPQMAMVSGLIDVLKMVGLTSSMVGSIQGVDIQKVNGKDLTGKDMPVTADIEGRNAITGEAYGQQLQGAAIDADTGEYLPANNTTPDAPLVVPFSFKTDTPEWKAAKGIGGTLGFGKQFAKAESKAEPVNGLIAAATTAAPAFAAALAGDPTQLMANAATATGAWMTKTTADFSNFVPENAGGILESALSGLAGPLIGTVNTGMSRSQLVETMEDVENRKARRSKTGRSRR
ncbi:tape measure protein [Rhodococcus phage Apiary]|nr:tape measure protein [Rhodococcus phage Braxoaddie]WNM67427.1 tape measure protein [Rhodococcus phage Polyyuki]WNM69851.1 tape measure protein [Rhodococcus phage Apiary]